MTREMRIDGSQGEGGGQVLRSSLALSMITGTPVELVSIRAGRKRPGLMRQHLTAVRAAAEISAARLDGDAVGATAVTFAPGRVRGGDYRFAVGSAGSATLVLQTVLPALLTAAEPSTLALEGGTHNPAAPPFPFLADTFLPLVGRMGPTVIATLDRAGFYPAGGGCFRVEIVPVRELEPLELPTRGAIRARRARAIVSNLPERIATRELRTVRKLTGWADDELRVEQVAEPAGPGNALVLQVVGEHLTETVTGFGQVGVTAEAVARRAVQALRRYLAAEVAVGEHLADQLLLPLALAGGGGFSTLPLSRHAAT